MEVTSGLRYKNRVRIASESYLRLAFRSYVIKSCKWDQKLRINYVLKLRQDCVTKITLELRNEVTLDLRQKTT